MSITFLNQPKISDNATHEEQNQRRLNLIPKIESWLSSHLLFKDKDVNVEFFQTGETGLVCIVRSSGQEFVLKVLLRPDGPQGEPEFLTACEVVGVSVPHVYEFGMLNEYPYILMSYVDAKSLEHSSEYALIKRNIFKKMGEVLRQIHKTKARGFGRIKVDGVGEYETFNSWLLESPQMISHLSYTKKHNLLPEEAFGSIEDVKKILIVRAGTDTQSVYCHWDFSPGNVLDTDPLTVFDPVVTYNHPYLDIARSIVQTIGLGFASPEVSKQFLDGYFGETQLDKKFLYSAVLFISHTKMPYWHKRDEVKILENLKSYLIANKYLKE